MLCPFKLCTHSGFSVNAIKRTPPCFPPSKQRVHKSHFLQKLSCQKPYWDKARLSSLVDKQAANNQHLSPQPSIQIQIYPQTPTEPKYGADSSTNTKTDRNGQKRKEQKM